MPGKLIWGTVAAVSVILYRRVRSRSVSNSVLKANFGERIVSPDDTGAVVAIMPNESDIELYIRCWGVDKVSCPRGVVLLIHGGLWHSRYFEPLAKELVKHRFVVYAYDLQSHGLSGSSRGVRGDFTGIQEVVNDTQAVLDFARGNHSAPVFVYGESFGAFLLLLWELQKKAEEQVAGLILAGAVVTLKKEMKPPRWIMPVLGLLSHVFPLLRLPNKEILDTFDDAFGDPAVPAAARKDPLVVFHNPTLRYGLQVLREMARVEKELGSVSSPLLIMHGLADIRTEWEKSKRVYDECASTDKTLKLYEGMKHQLLQETPENKKIVFDEIIEWLKARTADPPPQGTRKKKSGRFDLPDDVPFPSSLTFQEGSPNPPLDPNEIYEKLSRNGF